ncbi:MAG TPA: permease [Pirellulales bacterium]|jgi:AGZA family xanthine/uracil permease-like MFS transporter|nr:permease [Pirellulales bacterium]
MLNRYRWARAGDINAFFGLMLDNLAGLVLTVSMLATAFGFPANFTVRYMIPGTALGVVVGDVLFTWMAFRLARRSGRDDVTAMPLGLDTPSTIGMVLFVVGPAFVEATKGGANSEQAARLAWQIGICSIVFSGLIKLLSALGSDWIRRVVPRAGLLGSLAAIALVLISFLPLLDIFQIPIVGLASLAVILTTLVARVSLPLKIPGALGALLVGGGFYYLLKGCGWIAIEPASLPTTGALFPREWLEVFSFDWIKAIPLAAKYLPIVVPFALATVVGGIDCTESAAAVGDEFRTGRIIAVEGFATLVAGFCGGVIQTTPYIGHPAYKAMGGRAAYTLATALFIGSAGICGYFGYLYALIPQAALLPILIFVGLEITAQSFHATPTKHYAAVALACVPALASLVMIFADQVLAQSGKTFDQLAGPLPQQLQTMRILSGGFIITSLLWAAGLAALIDRRLSLSAVYFGLCGLFSLFGVIHSPLPGNPLILPWQPLSLPPGSAGQTPLMLGLGYLTMAALLCGWDCLRPASERAATPTPASAISAPPDSPPEKQRE